MFTPTATTQMLPGNTPCCRAATRPAVRSRFPIAWLACVGVAAAASAGAEVAQPRAESAPGQRAAAEESAPADAMAAYRTIRTWLDGWGLPSAPAPGDLPDCLGAAVLLRYDGRVIGRGTEMPADAGLTAADRDASPGRTIFRAAQTAFAEADRRVPLPRDATRGQAAGEVGRRVLLSVELCGQPTPVDAATFAALDELLAPGIDGLVLRQGGRAVAMSPAAMLAANLVPSEAARGLAAQLLADPVLALQELEALKARAKVSVLRFRTVHLAQAAPGAEPVFLTRGQVVVPLRSVNAGTLVAAAESLVLHLAGRLHDPDAEDAALGLRGTYLPWADGGRGGVALGRYQPAAAPPHEQGLAAFALARAARCTALSERVRARAAETVERLLHALADVAVDEDAPWDNASAAALTLLALRATDAAADAAVWRADLRSRCAAAVGGAWDDKAAAFAPAATGIEGVIALTLVREGAPAARAAVAATFERTPGNRLVAQWPWIGWAALELGGGPIEQSAERAAWVQRLRAARAELWANQLLAHEADAESGDMAGGVAFASAAGRAPPTWQCLRPMAFAASAWRDPVFTPEAERTTALVPLLWSGRYLLQLQAGPATGWMQCDPAAARGGVRSAVWDQTMPADASAMGLLVVVELCDTLRAGTR